MLGDCFIFHRGGGLLVGDCSRRRLTARENYSNEPVSVVKLAPIELFSNAIIFIMMMMMIAATMVCSCGRLVPGNSKGCYYY